MPLPADLPELNPDARLGTELEGWFAAFSGRLISRYHAHQQKALQCLFAANVNLTSGRSQHYSHWQVQRELMGLHAIPEVISPIIDDRNGIADIARVYATLRAHDYVATRSCGLHVHVSRKSRAWEAGEFWQLQNMLREQWTDYQAWVEPERRGHWPADQPDDALHFCPGYGTVEWKAREAATYADPSTLHYIVGIANFTLAAAENPRAVLADYLPPRLSHDARPQPVAGIRSPVPPAAS